MNITLTTLFQPQVALTDGQKWKLSAYQLNRTALHLDDTLTTSDNPATTLTNVVWHLPEDDLYSVTSEGEVEVNLELLERIVGMYLNEPEVEYQPAAGKLMNVKNNYNRDYLFKAVR